MMHYSVFQLSNWQCWHAAMNFKKKGCRNPNSPLNTKIHCMTLCNTYESLAVTYKKCTFLQIYIHKPSILSHKLTHNTTISRNIHTPPVAPHTQCPGLTPSAASKGESIFSPLPFFIWVTMRSSSGSCSLSRCSCSAGEGSRFSRRGRFMAVEVTSGAVTRWWVSGSQQ